MNILKKLQIQTPFLEQLEYIKVFLNSSVKEVTSAKEEHELTKDEEDRKRRERARVRLKLATLKTKGTP